MNDKVASALASVRYYNRDFTKRRLYMAWDNIGDERPLSFGALSD